MSSDYYAELAAGASALYYVCRPWGAEHSGRRGLQMRACQAKCGTMVVVTPSVFSDRMRRARSVGKELLVVCDDCVPALLGDGPAVLHYPSDEEIREANS